MEVVTGSDGRVDLADFVAQEYPAVVAAVRMITGDHDGAPDAVQDALVAYLTSPPDPPVRNLAAWVTVVASNRSRAARRSRMAEERALSRVVVASGRDEPVVMDTFGMDRDVTAALAQLPLQQREVAVLHYLLDQSVTTIAEGLGVSDGTVKTHLHRARKALARHLGAENGDV